MLKLRGRVPAWADTNYEAVREVCLRLRHRRYSLVRVGARLFTVEEPRKTDMPFYYANVKPFPRHRQRHTEEIRGTKVPFDFATLLHFRIDSALHGKFKKIEVVPNRWRRGWASDMVRALLKAHPDVNWQNESLNSSSGPLFEKLSAEYPERIAKVVHRTGSKYIIGDRPSPTRKR